MVKTIGIREWETILCWYRLFINQVEIWIFAVVFQVTAILGFLNNEWFFGQWTAQKLFTLYSVLLTVKHLVEIVVTTKSL